MASSCPNGTVVAGVSQSPGTPTSIASVQAAFVALIQSMPSALRVATNGADYVVVAPANVALPGRWLYTFGTVAGGKMPDAAQRFNANVPLAVDNVYVGYSYDSTADDLTPGNPWNGAANPFSPADFSKYVVCSPLISTNAIASVQGGALVSSGGSGEALELSFVKDATNRYRSYAGAPVAQYDDSVADPVTLRIYAIASTQRSAMVANWLYVNNLMGNNNTSGTPIVIMRTGGAWQAGDSPLAIADSQDPVLLADGVWRFELPLPAGLLAGACKGWWRCMRMTAAGRDRVPVLADDGVTVIGYTIGHSTTTDSSLAAFRSGTP